MSVSQAVRGISGRYRPVPSQRRPPRTREHPGSDTVVAPARRPPRAWRTCKGSRRAHPARATRGVRRRRQLWFAGDADSVLDEIESFLTGGRPAGRRTACCRPCCSPTSSDPRERAAQLGDDAWTRPRRARPRRRAACGRLAGRLVKFTGDGALATFDGPARAINCACAIRDAVEDLGLSIRAGLHTGEVEMADGDVHGIAVHIAARIMALAAPGEVLVSGVIPPLVLGSRSRSPIAAVTNSRACPDPGAYLQLTPR